MDGYLERVNYVVATQICFYCHPDPWGDDPI